MKEALWGYWLVVLGIFIIVVLLLVQSFTTTNTQDYYLIKSITEASMEDSIDWSYYRLYGELKINKEKFYETFLRRFAEEASLSSNYKIEFSGVYEAPPKVGVKISSKSSTFSVAGDSTTFDIVNKIDGILESKGSTYSVENLNNSSTAKPSGGSSTTTPGNTTTGGNTTTPGSTGNTTTPGGNETPEIEQTSCTKDIAKKWSNTVQGTSLVSGAPKGDDYMYPTLKDAKNKTNRSVQVVAGEKFTVLGENSSGDYLAVKYKDQSCGWVQAKYMGINLEQYMPKDEYPIDYPMTNASSSIFKVLGEPIKDVTYKALYTSDYVPLLQYNYAKKIRDNVLPKLPSGYRLEIYDAYRPLDVSNYVFNKIMEQFSGKILPYGSNGDGWPAKECSGNNYINCTDEGVYWHISWFIAQGENNHNYGCAIDATLSINGEVYETALNGASPMHDISAKAVVYSNRGVTAFRPKYQSDTIAGRLRNIMMQPGTNIQILNTEWWHFNDNDCLAMHPKGNVNNQSLGANNFWAAVK